MNTSHPPMELVELNILTNYFVIEKRRVVVRQICPILPSVTAQKITVTLPAQYFSLSQ